MPFCGARALIEPSDRSGSESGGRCAGISPTSLMPASAPRGRSRPGCRRPCRPAGSAGAGHISSPRPHGTNVLSAIISVVGLISDAIVQTSIQV